jgi:hypothetical protein
MRFLLIPGIVICFLFLSFIPAFYPVFSEKPFSPLSLNTGEEKITAKYLVSQMIASSDALQTVTFDLKIEEKCNGKMRVSTSHVKLQRHPQRIYMKLNGPELLFVKGSNDNKVLVNPAGFPYMDINLEVNSSTLHKDQHHTLYEVGFDFMAEIIKDAVTRTGPKFDEYFKYNGEVSWNNIPCYKLTVTDIDYKFLTYVVKKGETPISIARKLKLSEYKIGELNKTTDYDSPLKEGRVLILPSSYARITELLLEQKSFLPVSTKVFDNAGLFEAYEYMNLKINPSFAADEFTKSFKGYGF